MKHSQNNHYIIMFFIMIFLDYYRQENEITILKK